jgi:hypothetical protein
MTTSTSATTTVPAKTLGILSVVAAGASVLLGHTFILPIAAIVLGFIARSREPQSRTLSTIGIVGGFVILFWWAVVALIAGSLLLPLFALHHLF